MPRIVTVNVDLRDSTFVNVLASSLPLTVGGVRRTETYRDQDTATDKYIKITRTFKVNPMAVSFEIDPGMQFDYDGLRYSVFDYNEPNPDAEATIVATAER